MSNRASVVRGALSLTLRVSRVLGMAPLRFTPLRNDYSISVSRFYLAYSYIITIIIFITGMCAFLLDIPALLQTKTFQITTNYYRGWELDFFIMLSNAAFCCKAKSRMRDMILQLNIIQKTKLHINKNYKPKTEIRKQIGIALLFLILQFCLLVVDFSYDATGSANYNMCSLITTISLTSTLLAEIQMVLINLEVRAMFQLMSARLRQLVTLVSTEDITDSRIVGAEVRRLSHCYVSGCEVVSRINKADGFSAARLFFISIIFIVLTALNLSSEPSNQNVSSICFDIIQISWIIFFSSKATVFVEACHRITTEVRDMKMLLSELMYQATPVGEPLSLEMDIMFKETLLNAPEFAPLGIFTVNRSVIIATCSYITTYLILSIQFILPNL